MAATKHAGGRPTELDQVCRIDDNGKPVTVGEQVIAQARLGMDHLSCADSAGISRTTLHHWRLAGARARADEARGKRTLTPKERANVEFLNSLERADAEWEAARLATIAGASTGGFVVTKTSEKWVTCPVDEKNPEGRRLVERTVTTETLRPEWTAAAWLLERRKPDRYAKRFYSEITGKDGAPLVPQEDQARNLADELRAFQMGVDAEKGNARKVPAK